MHNGRMSEGWACGYFLARQGRRFLIVDAADAVASAWRRRWESLIADHVTTAADARARPRCIAD